MLVLTRKKSESVVITPPGMEPITIVIVDISSNRVRIGVDAEKEVLIKRSELKKDRGKDTSAQSSQAKEVT